MSKVKVTAAGAVLTGGLRAEMVVVEAGGVLEVDLSIPGHKTIVAEDGAVRYVTRRSTSDTEHSRRALGYSPRIDFRDGMRALRDAL